MAIFMQLLRKNGLLVFFVLGVFMLSLSISSSASASGAPVCDGLICVSGDDCGTKCVCNVTPDTDPTGVCLDDTEPD